MRSFLPSEQTTDSIPGLVRMIDQFDTLETSGNVSGTFADQYSYLYAQQNITTQDEVRIRNLSRSIYKSLSKRPMRFVDSFLPTASIITDTVNADVNALTDPAVKQQTIKILHLLEENMRMFANGPIPPVYVTELGDQSVFIEWIAEPFRMTFNIEKDEKQSGYVLISDELTGQVRNIGHFHGLSLDSVIQSLLILVFGNLRADYA